MHIAILAGEKEKEEFFTHRIPADVQITVADSKRAFEAIEADVKFYLSFENDAERINISNYSNSLLFVNDVCGYFVDPSGSVVRLNGWPSFLNRQIFEVALSSETLAQPVHDFFSKVEWKYEMVKNVPGLVTPRVVAALINEAYFTLGAHVSTKSEIDTAMKLGTNYPFGPFEWSELIGLEKIAALLRKLSSTDIRYEPAPALEVDLLLTARHSNSINE